ncbi:MAG TPA: glycosyltransferase family 39 protein [Terriglobales bacterium]|nr:glycosyltransferase family 39 protein [Terriglobales bacterium]
MQLARKNLTPKSDKTTGSFAAVLIVLAVIGMIRIVSTYSIFSQTTDEPAHLATGMEWLQRGTYTLEPLHPPLARIAVALGPYLSGLRLTGEGHIWVEGNEILMARGQHMHNLALARSGVLPFFLLATFLVWYWSRARYGNWPSLVGTLLFTTSPVVLAHAGLATTDMAVTATFTAALLALVNLLERASYLRSAIFGIAVGLAVLSKFSVLVFLPVSGLALLACRWLLRSHHKEKLAGADAFRWGRGLAVTALLSFLVVWAGYRFSVSSITDPAARPHPTIDRFAGTTGALHDFAYSVAESRWIPAPGLFRGVAQLRQKNATGAKAYLFGNVRQTGWWYFFPVALAVKTTIPFLVLIGVGTLSLARTAWVQRDWVMAAPVAAALALLLVCMTSQINIGVRHILPIYPLVAIIGGVGACSLWNSVKAKYAGPALLLVLLSWHLVSSVRTHPDYLAYFNEFAGHHPERILVDSDLDWGQDLLRLSAVLQQKHIENVSIAYAGSPDLDLHQFAIPAFRELSPHQPTTGWIAISVLRLKAGGFGLPSDSFSWLEAYKPVCLVGRSILLYHVPESTQREMTSRASNGMIGCGE